MKCKRKHILANSKTGMDERCFRPNVLKRDELWRRLLFKLKLRFKNVGRAEITNIIVITMYRLWDYHLHKISLQLETRKVQCNKKHCKLVFSVMTNLQRNTTRCTKFITIVLVHNNVTTSFIRQKQVCIIVAMQIQHTKLI